MVRFVFSLSLFIVAIWLAITYEASAQYAMPLTTSYNVAEADSQLTCIKYSDYSDIWPYGEIAYDPYTSAYACNSYSQKSQIGVITGSGGYNGFGGAYYQYNYFYPQQSFSIGNNSVLVLDFDCDPESMSAYPLYIKLESDAWGQWTLLAYGFYEGNDGESCDFIGGGSVSDMKPYVLNIPRSFQLADGTQEYWTGCISVLVTFSGSTLGLGTNFKLWLSPVSNPTQYPEQSVPINY